MEKKNKNGRVNPLKLRRGRKRRRVGRTQVEEQPPPETLSALSVRPLSPTLECDGGNDAAAAAVLAVSPPSSLLLFGCRLPGIVVTLGEARRIGGEAQLCIA